jgi:hypothetical protein
VACMLTYLLAAVAKLRFGGLAWLDSATLLRAVIRRGTMFGDLLAHQPWTLHVGQYLLVGAELSSPLLLARGRTGRIAVGVAFAFHAVVFATIGISFLPHLIAMASFLPLERLGARQAVEGGSSAVRTSSQVR